MTSANPATQGPDLEPSHFIQGREVRFPVVVREARSATATYLVPSSAAQALVKGDRLEVAEVLPGRTLFTLAFIDYVDNDLGDYNEVSMAFHVRPRGTVRGGLPYLTAWRDFFTARLGTYIRHLPVDQSFTCDAGATIWGFPKTVEQVDIGHSGRRSRCRLVMDGRHVMTASMATGGSATLPDNRMLTYTYIDGVAHETAFSSGASECRFRPGGWTLELGDHPIADDLRSLGLPKRPLLSVWMGRMHGSFEAPRPL